MAGELAALVGRNIRTARLEAELNQRELAQRIAEDDPAASNTAVSEWERGVRKPSDRYMPLIAAALGKPMDWFFRDHGQGETPELLPAPPVDEPSQLDRIEATITERLAALEAQVQLLRGELAARDAEVLRRISEVRPPNPGLRRQQQR